jgi:hypothetical protein
MIDPYEIPLPSSQDLCRRLLFKDGKKSGDSQFNRSLLSLALSGADKQVMVQFKSPYPRDTMISQNEVFCMIYAKYARKKNGATISLSRTKDFELDFISVPQMRPYVKPEDLSK